jgi:hypothetical protein
MLVVQLLPAQLCSATATAAALWLMHMLLFLLGPLSGWLQQQTSGTGRRCHPSVTPSNSSRLLIL